jgi:UDP-perosamine 4-acetyltransferase
LSTQSVIVIGAGGHAKVLTDALRAADVPVRGFVDTDSRLHGTTVFGIPVLGTDDVVLKMDPRSVQLANGIGTTGDPTRRRDVYESFTARGFRFLSITHPSAVVAPDVVLDAGVQVMAGAVIQPGCRIGANAIVNTGACVDHDCVVGAHAHIAPGAILCGEVKVGEAAHVGAGATVIQRVQIGNGALVAAGTVVVANAEARARIAGVPGQPIKQLRP